MVFNPNIASAQTFTIDSLNHLVAGSLAANVDAGQAYFTVYFNTADFVASGNSVYLDCNVDTGVLQCREGAKSVLSICQAGGNTVVIGPNVYPGCTLASLQALGV